MDIINFPLSITTLIIASLFPFAPFFYEHRIWFMPDRIKILNLIVTLIAAAFLAVIIIKGSPGHIRYPNETTPFLIIHAIPLIYTILRINIRPRLLHAPQSAGHPAPAKKQVQFLPSNKQVEKLSWDELVIDDKLKEEILSIVHLLKEPEVAFKYGIQPPKGILLAGPPGTGKTTIAKVIATTANLAFFSVEADEIISKWVGESEKNLSALFDAATKHAPAVIFIDEVDALGKVRTGEQVWQENLLNHLLQLVDGVIKREGLYIIAATNRPDLVDTALKRSGRLNRVIEIPLPDHPSRIQLFQLYLRRLNLQEPFNLDLLAQLTEGMSGADIKEICNQAGLKAFSRETSLGKRQYKVTQEDMKEALRVFLE
jgi:SpoVK/Ycf46/Vps4 family AAA+-type ATPase